MNIRIKGCQKVKGQLTPSGSKNSAVALIPASILIKGVTKLENVPDITDVDRLCAILQKLGSIIVWDKKRCVMEIDNSDLSFEGLTKEDVGNMRGVSLLWGPMLARFKKVDFRGLPGGCTLGARPLEPHFDAFKNFGISINNNDGLVMNSAGAKASSFWLTEMSPTVTENVLCFASTLKGKSKIIGAASDPQVQDVCRFLTSAGVKIKGISSNVLEIEGVDKLISVTHQIQSDHYEIATFLAIAASTGGGITIKNRLSDDLFEPYYSVFKRFGLELVKKGNDLVLPAGQKVVITECVDKPMIVRAQPWPALLVDTLPIFIPLALVAKKGQVLFHNWMYEAGLFWTSELMKFGANVVMCDPHRIMVTSGNKLYGATIEAPYIIRAVVALTMTAMIAEGDSIVLNADALYRGHPHFAQNLSRMGAEIEEIK